MIHPSYVELMKVVNHDVAIIGGADPVRQDSNQKKPLSVAVEELYHGDVKILSDEEEREPDM